METFWSFRLRFRRAYDSAYDSDIRFSLGHKLSYDSDYDSDSDSDSVASENQPLGTVYTDAVSFVTASVSMRLHLSFTRRRSSSLSEPCRFEYAFKSGAFSKRYGFEAV